MVVRYFCKFCGSEIITIIKWKRVFGHRRRSKIAYCFRCKKERKQYEMIGRKVRVEMNE